MPEYTNEEVVEIARRQKAILWLFLSTFVALFIPFAPLAITIINVFFVYQLAKALKLSSPLIWCLVMIIPIVCLLALLRLNAKATAAIRSKGITVSLMGAKKSELEKLAVSA